MLRYLRLLGQWALDWIGALGRASTVWFRSMAGLPRRGDMTLAAQTGLSDRCVVADHHRAVGLFDRRGARAAGLYAIGARRGGRIRGSRCCPRVVARTRSCRDRIVVCRSRGIRGNRRNRPDEGDRSAVGHGDDGRRSAASNHRAALVGGHDLYAAADRSSSTRWRSGVRRSSGSTGSASMPAASGAACRTASQRWEDIGKGMVKAGVFGVVISWIAVFQGYDSTPTAEGISVATTKTVVYSSVAVSGARFHPHVGHVRRLQLIRMRTIEISVGAFVSGGDSVRSYFWHFASAASASATRRAATC